MRKELQNTGTVTEMAEQGFEGLIRVCYSFGKGHFRPKE